MSDNVRALVPRSSVEAENVRSDVETLLRYVRENECIGIAAVVIRSDGSVGIQTRACGNRTLLLGAVTDLQFQIARDADD